MVSLVSPGDSDENGRRTEVRRPLTSANFGTIQPAAAAATSAAKSLVSFSMPSPSWKRT